MKQYLSALKHCLNNGIDVNSRSGKVRKSFGYQMRFNLQEGFPAITTKKLAWKAVVSELLWFLEGSNDERRLAEILYEKNRNDIEDKKTIWTQNAQSDYWKSNAKFEGDVGRIYGVQWRDFQGIDQISNLINNLKNDSHGRRHVICSWNPSEIKKMALPPCHVFSQFYVANKTLSCQLYQRSCDMFLGVPFNIASYSLLTSILANECGFEVGEFIHTLGDFHIYHEHFSQVKTQLSRKPKKLPKLIFNSKDFFSYSVNDFILQNYNYHSALKAKMNV